MSNKNHKLVDGPYQVLFTIAAFLPPSSNYHLKRVCRNFTDVVERLTENWVVPFIYSSLVNNQTFVGLFYFATLEVKISEKMLTPKTEMRGGKAYYKAVNEEQILSVVDEMTKFGKEAIDLGSKCCPMPQPVMVFAESAMLTRAYEGVIAAHVRFNAPSSDFSPQIGNNLGNKIKRDNIAVKQDQVIPTIWTQSIIAGNKEMVEDPERTEYSASGEPLPATKIPVVDLTPQLVRKSILQSVFSVLPAALPSFSAAESQDQGENRKAIVTKSCMEAAKYCGRPPFAAFFTSHVLARPEDRFLKNRYSDNGKSTGEEREEKMIKLIQEFDAAEEIIVNSPSEQLRRKEFGIRTSPELCALFHAPLHPTLIDFETNVYPLLKEIPRYYLTKKKDIRTWKNFWGKCVFLASKQSDDSQPPHLKHLVGNAALPLVRFFKLEDRLLVGEAANGLPVEVTVREMRYYFEKDSPSTFNENAGFYFAKFWSRLKDKHLHEKNKKQNEDDDENLVAPQMKMPAQWTPIPETTLKDHRTRRVMSNWVASTRDLTASANRFFLADDVSLGTVFIDEFYFPNDFVRKELPELLGIHLLSPDEKKKRENDICKIKCGGNRPEYDRLTTPWILLGEAGTFSDEHVEPKDLHVWVHLFIGTKMWFVKETTIDEATTSKQLESEWRMFFQEAGETIVVPPRVPHFVLNITSTFAIARNFEGGMC